MAAAPHAPLREKDEISGLGVPGGTLSGTYAVRHTGFGKGRHIPAGRPEETYI